MGERRRVTRDQHWPDHKGHTIVYDAYITSTKEIMEVVTCDGSFDYVHLTCEYNESIDDESGPVCMDCDVELSWDGSEEEGDLL